MMDLLSAPLSLGEAATAISLTICSLYLTHDDPEGRKRLARIASPSRLATLETTASRVLAASSRSGKVKCHETFAGLLTVVCWRHRSGRHAAIVDTRSGAAYTVRGDDAPGLMSLMAWAANRIITSTQTAAPPITTRKRSSPRT